MSEDEKTKEIESPFVLAAEVEPDPPLVYMSPEQFTEHMKAIWARMLARITDAIEAGKLGRITEKLDPITKTKTITLVIKE